MFKGGFGFLLALTTLMFVGLKLGGVIAWSWWPVFLPLLIPVGIGVLIFIVALIVALVAAYKTAKADAGRAKNNVDRPWLRH